MIRPATAEDLDAIVATYAELLDYEAEHGSFSNWEKGIYPTRDYASDVIANGEEPKPYRFRSIWGCRTTTLQEIRLSSTRLSLSMVALSKAFL